MSIILVAEPLLGSHPNYCLALWWPQCIVNRDDGDGATLISGGCSVVVVCSWTADDGCHFLHIHDELWKWPIYGRLSKAALRQCITELEDRGHVYESARWRYKTIDWLTERSVCRVRTGVTQFSRFPTSSANTHTQLFFGPFSGTTRVSQCQKRTSGLYGAREH